MKKIFSKIDKNISLLKLSKYGCCILDKIKLFLIYVNHFVVVRNIINGFKFKSIHIKYLDEKIILYDFDLSDFYILRQIFLKEEYKIDVNKNKIKTVLDLGANSGLFSIYASLNFPQATIYSFEPDMKTFSKIKKNTAFFDNIKVFNLAISDTDGDIFFYSSQKYSFSSSLKNRGKDFDKIKVLTKRLNTIIEELDLKRISILKFDIEGAEDMVFKNFKYFKIVDYIIGEIHLDLISISEKEFLSYFTDFSLKIKRLTKYRFLLYAKNKKIKH